LQEFVPPEAEIPEDPFIPAGRPVAEISPELRPIASAPTASGARGTEQLPTTNPSQSSVSERIETVHRTESREIQHHASETLVKPITLDQQRAEFRTLIHQIRSEFHATTVLPTPGPRDVTHTRGGERFVRTDRHTERIERTAALKIQGPGTPLPKASAEPMEKPNSGRTNGSSPEIYVHIGRIDVKVPSEKAETATVAEKPRGVISLEEYLAQRRQG
jgi:hypothetical protein